jgi:tetratricopeptide (TPR) repeat protein
MKKILFAALLLLVMIIWLTSPLWAGGADDAQAGFAAAASCNYDEAIRLFTKAIESGELSQKYLSVVYNSRGNAWINKGDYDKAIADLTKAIEIDPKYANSYYTRGIAWEKKGNSNRAIVDYSKATEINPKHANLPRCIQDLSNFECFQQNLESFFDTDIDLFWGHWNYYECKAKSCSSLSSTSQFISLAEKSDGVLAEVMGDFIETMILKKPRCFLGAAEKLDVNVMEYLIRYYILTPLVHEPSEILPIIEKELRKGNYVRFKKTYYSIKKSSRKQGAQEGRAKNTSAL